MLSGSAAAALIGEFYAERNREYPLRAPVFTAGRDRGNTLRIPDDRVADRHIRIVREREGFVLEAVSGERPTSLNGEDLESGDRRPLADGDRIRMASLPLRFTARGLSRPLPRLIVLRGVHGGKVFRLDGNRATVGRAPENDIQFPDRFVSRRHCLLERRSDGWWVRDLESTNGTWVEGTAVRGARRLRTEEEVSVGFSSFRMRGEGAFPLGSGGRARPAAGGR